MAKFIATGALTSSEGKNTDRTIYGVGNTPEAAIADGRTWGATGELTVTACTKALADAVNKRGGDIEWKLVDGVADIPRTHEEIIATAQLALRDGFEKIEEFSKQVVTTADGQDIAITLGNAKWSILGSPDLMTLLSGLECGEQDVVRVRAGHWLEVSCPGSEKEAAIYDGENFGGGVDAEFKWSDLAAACMGGDEVELIQTRRGHVFINRVEV